MDNSHGMQINFIRWIYTLKISRNIYLMVNTSYNNTTTLITVLYGICLSDEDCVWG